MNRKKSVEIEARLRKNGGPLATEAADCIQWLLNGAHTKKRGEIHPHHKAIVLLFQKSLNKPTRDGNETTAFNAIRHTIEDEDLEKLRHFYRQPEPKQFDKLLSCRKRSPLTLLRAFSTQVDLAHEYWEKFPPVTQKKEIHEPEGWQVHAPGNLGNMSWHLVCQKYPDIAKELQEACKAS